MEWQRKRNVARSFCSGPWASPQASVDLQGCQNKPVAKFDSEPQLLDTGSAEASPKWSASATLATQGMKRVDESKFPEGFKLAFGHDQIGRYLGVRATGHYLYDRHEGCLEQFI